MASNARIKTGIVLTIPQFFPSQFPHQPVEKIFLQLKYRFTRIDANQMKNLPWRLNQDLENREHVDNFETRPPNPFTS